MNSWLGQISFHYPIITSGEYKSRYNNKGRDRLRRHSSLIADGMIYDPAETRENDIESYEHTFNKSLNINAILIIELERPNFGRQTKL